MVRRIFTVEAANALITRLEEVFTQVDAQKAEVRRLYDRIQVLDLLWGERLREPGNPDHAEALLLRDAIRAGIEELEQLVHAEIVDRGMRLPAGGLEHGLVDFPTTWQGRAVYLCWQRGERELRAWHELDGGFAGRQELRAEHQREMGRDAGMGLPDDPLPEG